MFRQLQGAALASSPASSPASDAANGHDGGDRAASASAIGPGLESGERPTGLPPLPSFSLFFHGQGQHLQTRPRIRRREAKPSAEKHKSTSQSSFTQNTTLPSPVGTAFTQLQPPKAHGHEPRKQKRPYSLRDPGTRETSTPPPPSLPSPPTSVSSSARSHRDIEQSADNSSRYGFDFKSRRSYGNSAKQSAPAAGSSISFGQFNYKMSGLRLHAGGNAPVSDLDLEVDLDLKSEEKSVPAAGQEAQTSLCNSRMGSTELPSPQQPVAGHVEPESRQCDIPAGQSTSLPSGLPGQSSLAGESMVCQSLSLESSPLFHHTLTQNSIASSGYDMRSWLESSSTVEVPLSLVAGTVDANTMAGIHLTAMAQAMSSWKSYSSTHQPRSSPLKTAHTPPQPAPSHPSQNEPVGLAEGLHSPVANVEVDMTGYDMDICDIGGAMKLISPLASGSLGRDLSPSSCSPEDGLRSALAKYLELKDSGPGGFDAGRHVPLSQRIRMAYMELEREMMLRQAGYLPEEPLAVGEPAANEYVDVEMRDPATAGLPSGGPHVMGGSGVDYPVSLLPESQLESVRKYMGPLRYRLSSEVAMRCTNLVHSKPRMRRRRLSTDSKASMQAGNVGSMDAKDGSIRDSAGGEGVQGAQATQSKDKERQSQGQQEQQGRSGTRAHKHKLSRRRELARQSSRSPLAHAPAHMQVPYEKDAHIGASEDALQQASPSGQLPLPELDASQVDSVLSA